jgi:hypothetical protein
MIPVFLIKGPRDKNIYLNPLKAYLNIIGYKEVYIISYQIQPNYLQTDYIQPDYLQMYVEYVSNQMINITVTQNQEVILIGISIGGIISHHLHQYGWKIHKSITIVSPHNGNSFFKFIKYILPTNILEYIYHPIYNHILKKTPPHEYHTIGTSILPYIPFDGHIWNSETNISLYNHVNISFNNNWTIFLDPRIFFTISNLLNE